MVAAKDIWKLGPMTSDGETQIIMMAEMATFLRLIEGRSNSTAISMIDIISQARSADTANPEIR
ncbi:hypothetical protein D3C86_2237420 [compost metagenome]